MRDTSTTLTVLVCENCGRLDPGPRELCANCASDHLSRLEVEGRGTLVSSTVIRRPPTRFRADGAYTIGVIDLDAGVRITGRMVSGEESEPGSAVYLVETRERIPYFRSKVE